MAVIAGVQASLGLQSAAFTQGLNQAAAGMTKLGTQANATANQLNSSFQKVSRETRVMRGQFNNLAFQLQDVAVQWEMGIAPMRIFTQQAGQIAQIFGPLGATLGIVVTVIGALAGAWAGASSAAAKLKEETDNLDGSLADNIKTLDDAIEQYRQLTEEQRAFENAATVKKLRETNDALRDQKKQLDDTLGAFREFSANAGGGLGGLAEGLGMLGPMRANEFAGLFKFDPEVFQPFLQMFEQFEAGQITIGAMATEWNELVNDMVQRGAEVPPKIMEMANALLTTTEAMHNMEGEASDLQDRLSLLGQGMLDSAVTTKEALTSVDALIDVWDEEAAAEKRAGEQAASAAQKRSEGISKLQEEADGTRRLSAAYSENVAAVRDAEIAIAAQTKIRALDIDAGSKQAQQIVELTKSIRENEDAIKLRKTIIASGEEAKQLDLIIKARGRETEELRVQQALLKVRAEQNEAAAKAAEKQIRATEAQRSTAALSEEQAAIEDIIDQQRLLLRYGSDESEEYRVQLRLLQLKQSGVKDITPEMEKQIRLLEQQATGISAQEDAAKKIQELYENALQGIQDSFTDMFEEIYSGGITSFQDLASAIKDVFVRLAAELTTLLIIRPTVLGLAGSGGAGGAGGLASLFGFGAGGAGAAGAGGAMVRPAMAPAGMPAGMMTGLGMPFAGFGAAAMAGGPAQMRPGIAGWQQGLIGGPAAMGPATPWWQPGRLGAQGLFMSGALGAVGGSLIGGQFGGYGGVGGGIGGGIGAVAGGLTPLGPFGAIAGGLGGSLLGGALGGLFGGGTSGNEVSFGGAALGVAGRGGTGKAAEVVRNIDKALQDVLSMRQEALVNDMLRVAPSVSIKYGEEGPSAGDLASLARARIAPAASALGLSAKGITGGLQGPPKFTAEEMAANFEQALGILQQIEDIQLGPLGAELQALKDNFNDTARAAKKFGIDNRAALEEQYRFERAATQRRFAAERVELEEMFGQRTPLSAALAQLELEFDEAGARAKQLGISTAGMGAALAQAQEEVRAQAVAQRAAIIDQARGLAALPQTFKSTFDALIAQFTALRASLRELGGDLTEITALQKQATAALVAQRAAQVEALHAEARGLAGQPAQSAGQRFADLMAHFTRLRDGARALGTSLDRLTAIQKQATAAFQAQIAAELAAISVEAKRLVGLPATAGQRFDELMANFLRLRAGARALGGSLSELTSLQKQATLAFIAQIAAEKTAILVQAQQLTGLPPTFAQEFAALMLQFMGLRNQARGLGMDLGKLTEIQKEAQASLVREQQLRQDQMALSITNPFKQLLDPLQAFSQSLNLANLNPAGQLEAAEQEFKRIANLAMSGSTIAIQQLEGAGRAFIEQAGRFGASPALVQANIEVKNAVDAVASSVAAAQREASRGVEDAIARASRNEVDTIKEVVAAVRIVADEIKRLGRK